jgi:hypothetical protein
LKKLCSNLLIHRESDSGNHARKQKKIKAMQLRSPKMNAVVFAVVLAGPVNAEKAVH